MQNFVRPIAIAVIERKEDHAILVFQGYDPHRDLIFYRPLGGSIEFGEPSEQTVRRELLEETGLELRDVRFLTTIENIFTYRGESGHEIVMVYHAQLAETSAWAYEQQEIHGQEDNGEPFVAYWMPLDRFGTQGPLYPTGLLRLLTNEKDA